MVVQSGLSSGLFSFAADWTPDSAKAVFPPPREHVYTERNGEGFVDDTTLWETSEHLTPSTQ